MTSDAHIDDAIMAVLAARDGRWVKVAWVVVSAPNFLGGEFPAGESGHELIADRISHLVKHRRLVVKGDITQWRFSEVRPA